jgi:polyvinyl alcohol dehydrogenase (cytochrome)
MTRSLRCTFRTLAAFALLTAQSTGVLSAEKPAADVVTGDPKDWPMFNHDAQGTRNNFAETRLDPRKVRNLAVVWRHDTRGAVAGTPAVVNDVVYAGDTAGWVYALTRDGKLLWETQLPDLDKWPIIWGSKITASVLVTNRTLVIPDWGGFIHGLDVATGAVRWTTRPPCPGPVFGDQHPVQVIFGSATMVGKNVAIGISSLEEGAVRTPNYKCCTFRGSLVLLDPANGSIIWQTFMTEVAKPGETDFGPSGAAIWSTPTYDPGTKTIYATTGNNYSKPTTGTSDAIVAFDAADGHIKWVSQKTQDDFWNFRFVPKQIGDPPDFDFGDSPQIYKIRGRTVVGAGQKSGFYHVVDARTGGRINEFQVTKIGGNLGGLFADSAFADGVAFTNGSIWPDPFGSPDPPVAGVISAVAGDASTELWRFETPGSPNISGLAVADGVLYFQSMTSGLYALDVSNGNVLAKVDVNLCDGSSPVCGQTSGPAVSRGQVYLGAGDVLSSLFDPFRPFAPGAIFALGIQGDSDRGYKR